MLFICNGCQDSGSVGGDIGNSGPEFSVDSVKVTTIRNPSFNAFSGGRTYFSAGQFDDPAFGNLKAIGYLKPQLVGKRDSTSFDKNTTMRLKLAINNETVYGDSTATEKFNLVEINDFYRQSASKFKDVFELKPGGVVASFAVAAGEDTLNIPLPQRFVQKYGQFYNQADSARNGTFEQDFNGLAVVPQNSGKITTFDPGSSRFLVKNLKTSNNLLISDSLSIPFRDYSYSINRQANQTTDSSDFKIYNTLEKVLAFKFNFGSFDPINITKAELILKRDNLFLDNKGDQITRPAIGVLALQCLTNGPQVVPCIDGTGELPQSIDRTPSNNINNFPLPGIYDKTDKAYHFNLTLPLKAGVFGAADSTITFYITLGTNDGVIRSNLLFDEKAGNKSPQVIISTVKNR